MCKHKLNELLTLYAGYQATCSGSDLQCDTGSGLVCNMAFGDCLFRQSPGGSCQEDGDCTVNVACGRSRLQRETI